VSNVFGWLCLVLVLVGLGVVAGVYQSNWWADERLRSLNSREAKLQQEWDALHTAQRLNAAFLEARRAMWEEAIRARREPGSP
jgi:hypothetical protein